MLFVAFRNLLHDKLRLAITLVGITFAVALIMGQMGMFFGFMKSSSSIIDHSSADIWIVSRNSANFDWSRPFPERYLQRVRSTAGVARAETLLFAWSIIRLPRGGSDQVEIVGFHPEAGPGWGQPWSFVEGGPRSVLGGDGIIIDESSKKRLGPLVVGDRLEISNREVRVVGRTKGIRSMTTAPYLFTNYETAHKLAHYLGAENTVFILVQAEPGADLPALVSRLGERLPNVDVLTRQDYALRTQRYWAVQTGMGFAFLLTALLGALVGTAIVGQTIYADTMEHLKEYATLKAIGGGPKEIVTIIWSQAGVSAVVGYALGACMAVAVGRFFEALDLTVVFPGGLWAGVAVLTACMCLGSSAFSIHKVLKLDAAMVFRGS